MGLQFRVESPGDDRQRSVLKMMFYGMMMHGGGKEKARSSGDRSFQRRGAVTDKKGHQKFWRLKRKFLAKSQTEKFHFGKF